MPEADDSGAGGPAPGHDHRRCQSQALEHALAEAEARGLRLTPLRRTVLELVAESHRPVGAYAVLERLAARRAAEGARAAPPTVYRALEFLLAAGLVHRIDSLNAFIACFAGPAAHGSVFLICEACREVREIADAGVADGLAALAQREGFRPSRQIVEVQGRCPACRVVPPG